MGTYFQTHKETNMSKRLPKVWDIIEDISDAVMKQEVEEEFQNKWAPGDIIQAEDYYQVYCMYIITTHNHPVDILDDASSHIPDWAVDIALKNGFAIEDIIDAYSDSRAAYLEYPKHLGRPGLIYSFDDMQDVEISRRYQICAHHLSL
jgi:hypothetical protein